MLGGSSSINFMMYVRGNKEDYNTWAEELNDPQWNYEGVLPYFKKSQDYNGYWPFNRKTFTIQNYKVIPNIFLKCCIDITAPK